MIICDNMIIINKIIQNKGLKYFTIVEINLYNKIFLLPEILSVFVISYWRLLL